MNTIYLVRHAEYENNISKKININPINNKKLTKKGIEQAKKVSLELKNIKFDKVLVSEFLRTQETASHITNLKQEITPILNELKIARENSNYETHNKKVKDQIFKNKFANTDENIFEKIKTLKKFLTKLEQNNNKSNSKNDNKINNTNDNTNDITNHKNTSTNTNTLIVTHKDIIRLLIIINENLTIEKFYELNPKNCSIYKIEY